MNFSDYVQDVNKRYIKGDAREHTYRGSLQNLLETKYLSQQREIIGIY